MRWYEAQEKAGLFRPEAAGGGAEPFTVVIPPPNVTGRLHVGHALGRTLEDVLCRWRRMQGRAVLWVPGVDHAGIATQMVVERDLKERTGRSRHDLGREAFVALCREWADARRGDILNQVRRLGCSCDFTREYYTLDAVRSRAVRHRVHDALRAGPRLSRRAARELVSELRDGPLRPRGEPRRDVRAPVVDRVPRGGRRGGRRRDDAARDDARRHRGRRSPRRRAIPGSRRQARDASADGPDHPGHRRRLRRAGRSGPASSR